MFKRKSKSKKKKYVIKLSDYEALKLTEALTETIIMCMRDIEDVVDEKDKVSLYDLLLKKRTLMAVMKRFGSNIYNDELNNLKPITKEIDMLLDDKDDVKNVISSAVDSSVDDLKDKPVNLL